MAVERMGYIVYYRGRNIARKLKRMPVNIAYISRRMNYAVFYGNKDSEESYLNNLKRTRGFVKLEASEMFNESLNYSLSE